LLGLVLRSRIGVGFKPTERPLVINDAASG